MPEVIVSDSLESGNSHLFYEKLKMISKITDHMQYPASQRFMSAKSSEIANFSAFELNLFSSKKDLWHLASNRPRQIFTFNCRTSVPSLVVPGRRECSRRE